MHVSQVATIGHSNRAHTTARNCAGTWKQGEPFQGSALYQSPKPDDSPKLMPLPESLVGVWELRTWGVP